MIGFKFQHPILQKNYNKYFNLTISLTKFDY
jgi:hypothetical protein